MAPLALGVVRRPTGPKTSLAEEIGLSSPSRASRAALAVVARLKEVGFPFSVTPNVEPGEADSLELSR